MAARLLSLASGVLPEFTPEQTAYAAIAGGWRATGLWVEPSTWTAKNTRAIRAIAKDAALAVLDIEVIWIKPGKLDPDHLRIIDIGAEIGAPNVLAVSSDPDMDATEAKLAALAAYAAPAGLRISLECAAFTAVRGLQDALTLLARPALTALGVLVDPLHFARMGGIPADLRAIPLSRLAYAQFCDAPAAGPHPDDAAAILHEAIDLRRAPGDGDLPLLEFLNALPQTLPLSVEVRSKALRDAYPVPAERAAALLSATMAFFSRAQDEKPL